MNLYFFFFWFTDFLLSVLMASAKNGRMPFYRLLCLVFAWCVKFLFVQVFRVSREKRFVTALDLYFVNFFFAAKPFVDRIHCLLHRQPNIFIWKKLGHIWCADTNDLLGQNFPNEHPAVCSLTLPLLWENGYDECVARGFPCTKGRSFLLQGFRHKTVL